MSLCISLTRTVATADIAPDTVLFTIPREAILCAATSPLAQEIPSLFAQGNDQDNSGSDDGNEDDNMQNPWTLLILMLIREHLRGEASPWKAYLDILPQEFDTPMFWGEADVAELQASSVVGKIGRAEADAMLRAKVVSVLRANEDVFFPAGAETAGVDDAQLLALAHRMGSAIMAYAFDLDKDEGEGEEDNEDGWVEDREGRSALGMVPMADILNADAEFNAHINHGDGDLTAVALRPIRAGEEILNYYGPLPNGELLRRYGYVTTRHSRYDVVELPWGLVETRLRGRLADHLSGVDWEKVAESLAEETEEDEGEEDVFVLERESEDPDATGQFQGEAVFAGLPEELGKRVKTFLKAVQKAVSGKSSSSLGENLADNTARKEIYLESVLGALADRESQYATKLEEDELLVGSSRPTGRTEMAVFVRAGEKRLLREAQAWVTRELETMHAESSNRPRGSKGRSGYEDAPVAKRRRM